MRLGSLEFEIVALRVSEAQMCADASEADRLVRQLMCRYRADFVIANNFPDGTWGWLPAGWQAVVHGPVTLHSGYPPRDVRGAIALSLSTLRRLAL